MLVVAPVSVLPNWASEFSRFAPKIAVLRYEGSKETRATIADGVVAKVMQLVGASSAVSTARTAPFDSAVSFRVG
jgi:SNF2 family DNA or RNA helicase